MRCRVCACPRSNRTISRSPSGRLAKNSLLPRPTQSSPHFKWPWKGHRENLHPIVRDEVYRIAAEALRNAFRHAAAENVEVEIRYDEE